MGFVDPPFRCLFRCLQTDLLESLSISLDRTIHQPPFFSHPDNASPHTTIPPPLSLLAEGALELIWRPRT